jgi:hypothetical protein
MTINHMFFSDVCLDDRMPRLIEDIESLELKDVIL